ncbi:putative claudin-25 [Sceloporus undulatus]|uniref:putative claudin-25 n=1 Tax=Sceloporus undulatus TaxID=8520 RepID=UPI001C4C8E1D|nr:putative claudin-25 [Sceloporus undulatus]
MAWHHSTIVQFVGLTLSFLGWALSCVTTYVPAWKKRGLQLNDLEIWTMGLWRVCIAHEGKTMECKSHDSFLALPLEIKVSRIIMVTSNVMGFLGIILSFSGSNCVRTRDQNPGSTKQLLVPGGIVLCLSGMATLAPVSWTAYNIVQEFWDKTVPQIVSRWDFGDALFLGWFSGFFLILGGFIIICSACYPVTRKPPRQLAVQQKLKRQKSPMLPNHYQNSTLRNAYLVI